jgi:hypothetical protein
MVQSLLEFPDTCSQGVVLGLKAFSFVHTGERCSLVFVQVIVDNIYALLRTFYQDGLSAALPYGCNNISCASYDDALRPLLTTVRSIRTMRLHVEAFRTIQAQAPIGNRR